MNEEVRITRLANGLRVATDTVRMVETVTLGVWVEAGTRHESADVNGISHLLEHMAFKGTARRTARAIAEEIEAVGGQLNAHTARDHTAYYAKVLKEDAELALDIVADILQHPALDPDELAREREVVVQEIGQAGDTPDDIIFDHFQATAYPDQAVGRPVLGSADRVRGFSRGVLRHYMDEHYGAARMILSAAGNIGHDEFVAMAERHFDALPAGRGVAVEPARYVGGDFREVRDLEQVHLLFGFESVPYRDPDYYAVSVLSTLLGGGMSSRLFQEVREARGLAYAVYSFSASLEDTGLFGIYAGAGESEVSELVPVVCDQVMRAAENITADELRRARAQLKAGILMALESTGARCEQLARQLVVYGRPLSAAEVIAAVETVDEGAVARVARRLFASPLTFAALGPLKRVEDYDRIEARLG